MDLGTRGISADQLCNSNLWKFVPDFLVEAELACEFTVDSNHTAEFLKKPKIISCATAISNLFITKLVDHYSSDTKLLP